MITAFTAMHSCLGPICISSTLFTGIRKVAETSSGNHFYLEFQYAALEFQIPVPSPQEFQMPVPSPQDFQIPVWSHWNVEYEGVGNSRTTQGMCKSSQAANQMFHMIVTVAGECNCHEESLDCLIDVSRTTQKRSCHRGIARVLRRVHKM